MVPEIVRKLDAREVTTRSDVHDEYGVFHNDRLVASFGVSRTSRKGKGCDHIPGDLNVGPNFVKQLARCTKYREDYLRRIGEIEEGQGD